MKFPKFINIFVPPSTVQNVTETGEVTATSTPDLDIIKLITKGLGCSYKVYSFDLIDHIEGHLAIGSFPILEENYKWMSYPYASTDVTFATEKPPFVVTTFSSLKAFTLNVWISLFCCIILASFIHFLTFWRKIPLVSASFYIVGTLFGKHHNWRPKSRAQKMLILTWSVGIMFITLSYGSVLLSFLTTPVREKGITDLDDLYEAARQKKAIAVNFENSFEENSMAMSENIKVRFLGEHIKLQKKINNDNALLRIKPNVAVIATRRVLNRYFEGEKHFISQDSIMLSYYGIYDVTDEYFCCMERLNKVIHWIWAGGFSKKVYEDIIFRKRLRIIFKHKDLIIAEDPIRPLSLAAMSGAFYFLLIGHILGLICLFCEMFTNRYSYKV